MPAVGGASSARDAFFGAEAAGVSWHCPACVVPKHDFLVLPDIVSSSLKLFNILLLRILRMGSVVHS